MLCFRFFRTGLLDSASETFWLGIHFQVVGAVFRSHEFAKNNKKISKCDFQKKNPLQRSYIFAKFSRIFLWQNHVPACSKLSVSTEMQGRLESATTHEESPKFRSSRCRLYALYCIVHNTFCFPSGLSKKKWDVLVQERVQNTLGSSRESVICNTRESTFFLVIVWQYFNALEESMHNVHVMANDGMMLLPRTMFFRSCS